MPATKSQLSEILNLELDSGDFILNCDSDAFDGRFVSFELRPGPSTAIRTVEEVEKILGYLSAKLKRITEIYRQNNEQVKLQLKLKVSRILGGNVEESSTVTSVPMWSSSSIEIGVDKLLVELKRERVPQEDVRYMYFPIRVQIMMLSTTVWPTNTFGDSEDEGLINMSRRARRELTFKHVGNKYPLDYVMFCSFEYEKIPYYRQRDTKPEQWCLYSKPSMAFIVDGPTDGKGIDTGGVHWLRGEDVIRKFIDKMSRLDADMVKNLNQKKKKYDKKKAEKYKHEPNCCICDKPIGIDRGHIHHCHRTGNIFGRAHSNCNSNYAQTQSSLPVFVHCQEADDFHGILISLFHDRGLKILSPTNSRGRDRDEEVKLTLEGLCLPLIFLNARRFLPDSLQNLKNCIPRTNFKRSERPTSYFRGEPVPPVVETTLLLADTILFVRERIRQKVELDICRYHTLNEFIVDAVLKKTGINLILPVQRKGTIRPYPGTLKTKIFELSEFSATCPIVRAMRSYLPTSEFTSLPETEFQKFHSKSIAKLSNTDSVGYIFQITENDNAYFVHYILLKYLIKKNRNFRFVIGEIIQFHQTPFMHSFLSAFLTGPIRFHLDRKLGQLFCKNIIEYSNMVKPRTVSFKSVPVVEAVDFHEQIEGKDFITANCFAENLVEVILSHKCRRNEFTYLSLALRDLIFTYSNE